MKKTIKTTTASLTGLLAIALASNAWAAAPDASPAPVYAPPAPALGAPMTGASIPPPPPGAVTLTPPDAPSAAGNPAPAAPTPGAPPTAATIPPPPPAGTPPPAPSAPPNSLSAAPNFTPPPPGTPPPPPGTPPPPAPVAPNYPPPAGTTYAPAPPDAPTGYVPQPDQIYYPPPRYRRSWGDDRTTDGTYSLGIFRIAEMGVIQGAVHQYVPYLSWNPEIQFGPEFYAGISLGGTVLTDALNSNFFALDFHLVVGTRLWDGPIGVEGGVGFQDWGDSGGTNPMLVGSLYYGFNHGPLERIFIQYGALFLSDFYTSEIKAGFAIQF